MLPADLKNALKHVESYVERSEPLRYEPKPQALVERREVSTRLARAAIRCALAEALPSSAVIDIADQSGESLLWMSTLAIAAQGAVLGECRRQAPYAPLRPVLTDVGLRWCCTHDPEHCDR